jgi:hypothetical protein
MSLCCAVNMLWSFSILEHPAGMFEIYNIPPGCCKMENGHNIFKQVKQIFKQEKRMIEQ